MVNLAPLLLVPTKQLILTVMNRKEWSPQSEVPESGNQDMHTSNTYCSRDPGKMCKYQKHLKAIESPDFSFEPKEHKDHS